MKSFCSTMAIIRPTLQNNETRVIDARVNDAEICHNVIWIMMTTLMCVTTSSGFNSGKVNILHKPRHLLFSLKWSKRTSGSSWMPPSSTWIWPMSPQTVVSSSNTSGAPIIFKTTFFKSTAFSKSYVHLKSFFQVTFLQNLKYFQKNVFEGLIPRNKSDF